MLDQAVHGVATDNNHRPDDHEYADDVADFEDLETPDPGEWRVSCYEEDGEEPEAGVLVDPEEVEVAEHVTKALQGEAYLRDRKAKLAESKYELEDYKPYGSECL